MNAHCELLQNADMAIKFDFVVFFDDSKQIIACKPYLQPGIAL
ncbi:hypothetical protein [Alteromonas sp. RKMC-009]|nr:hypothetical protein [Alteromonas sp. RKMC-009]